MKFDRDPNFIKSRQTNDGTFTIAHYAGRVTYTAYEWLEKNRDTMPPGATQMLQTAENKLLSLIFKGKPTTSILYRAVDAICSSNVLTLLST